MTITLTDPSRLTNSTGRERVLDAWRGLGAAGVFLSAVVHLELYAVEGFKDIKVIGPAFLFNAVAGLVIGFAVLLWRSWIPAFFTFGFGLATLGAYYISATVGLFKVHETWGGSAVILAEVAEWLAVVAGIALLLAAIRSRRAAPIRP